MISEVPLVAPVDEWSPAVSSAAASRLDDAYSPLSITWPAANYLGYPQGPGGRPRVTISRSLMSR